VHGALVQLAGLRPDERDAAALGCETADPRAPLTAPPPRRRRAQELKANPYAWNRGLANVLFLESPAFVGFSFSDRPGDAIVGASAAPGVPFCCGLRAAGGVLRFFSRACVLARLAVWFTGRRVPESAGARPRRTQRTRARARASRRPRPAQGDARTASDARAFLLGWLERFPQYAEADLFISGESYGGALAGVCVCVPRGRAGLPPCGREPKRNKPRTALESQFSQIAQFWSFSYGSKPVKHAPP
jgi:hypothetical protein